MTPHPQHCDHECVCHNRMNTIAEIDAPCTTKYCKYDTRRSRPHPAAAYPDRHEAYLEGLRDARLNAETAAHKAREDVLVDVRTMRNESVIIPEYAGARGRVYHEGSLMAYDRVIALLEKQSLRSTQQQAGDGDE